MQSSKKHNDNDKQNKNKYWNRVCVCVCRDYLKSTHNWSINKNVFKKRNNVHYEN